MRSFGFYALIIVTVLGCTQFLAMLAWYLSWRQAAGFPAGPDIGYGMVMLSGCLALIPILAWLAYGVILFCRSDWTVTGPYFSGWRRKSGLILLAVSCLLCMGMVRSYYVTDRLNAFGGRFESKNGSIERSVRYMIVVGSIGGSTESPSWSIPYLSILAPLALACGWLLLGPQPKSVADALPNLTPEEKLGMR